MAAGLTELARTRKNGVAGAGGGADGKKPEMVMPPNKYHDDPRQSSIYAEIQDDYDDYSDTAAVIPPVREGENITSQKVLLYFCIFLVGSFVAVGVPFRFILSF